MTFRAGFILTAWLYFGASFTSAADQSLSDTSLPQQATTILQKHCIRCHQPNNKKGKLSLVSLVDIQKGGRHGQPWIPGKPDTSRLIKLISPTAPDEPPEMPEEGDPLSNKEIETLKQWIKAGAIWPKNLVLKLKAKADLTWWSLQPVKPGSIPSPKSLPASWNQNPIDRFIFARLAGKELHPSKRASKSTLIRRLYFDLIGLPPTPAQVASFVKDNSPGAYEKLVDQLLASPRHGERWGRHWLDIAHYADTHGFERDMKRDHAWRYRDYVIASLNSDKSYFQFIREQIAGDIIAPSDPQAVIATGFLAAGPFDFVGQVETKSPILRRQARADDLDDIATTVISATMGLTINCARCHDHKLDPISQEDYYQMWAVFAGVKRGDRNVPDQRGNHIAKRKRLQHELSQVQQRLASLEGKRFNLADVIGGGSGFGSGKVKQGIDPRTGKQSRGQIGFITNIKTNTFVKSPLPFIDGIVIPGAKAKVPITSTGITINNLPATSGQTWDYVQLGPVHSQRSTVTGGVNYNANGHQLIGLHANKILTFDLKAIRDKHPEFNKPVTFKTVAAYGGRFNNVSAQFAVYVDGNPVHPLTKITPKTPGIPIAVVIKPNARFITLAALDNNNGISHDQVYFGDPVLVPTRVNSLTQQQQVQRDAITRAEKNLHKQLAAIPPPTTAAKVYAVQSTKPQAIHVLNRGNPETPRQLVSPAGLSCVKSVPASTSKQEFTLAKTEGERRLALANWIAHPKNPLTSRVIANRLWHYHFGAGIVKTPSDFGYAGGKPSHPKLLDWLAATLLKENGSLKAIHRLIVTSQTYQQKSLTNPTAAAIDADNRLLWRMNSRRLEAEAIRDTVLAVSGKLNLKPGGPGYQDFKYQQEYAPIYTFITPDTPDVWRRTVYRFVVRTTPNTFMDVLDCPNPSVLTPARNQTTTALQSLALLNNRFMLQQTKHFASRIEMETAADKQNAITRQIDIAFTLAFCRKPTDTEHAAAAQLVEKQGLFQLCRMLLNANEFVYID